MATNMPPVHAVDGLYRPNRSATRRPTGGWPVGSSPAPSQKKECRLSGFERSDLHQWAGAHGGT